MKNTSKLDLKIHSKCKLRKNYKGGILKRDQVTGKIGRVQEAGLQPSLLGNGSKELMVLKVNVSAENYSMVNTLKTIFLGNNKTL